MDSNCNWRSGGGYSPQAQTLLGSIPRARAAADCEPKYKTTSEVFMGNEYAANHRQHAIAFDNGDRHMDNGKAIGARIRWFRKERKLTQVQLSKAIGIDQSTLSDIERGGGFSAETLMRLSSVLNESPQTIMLGERRRALRSVR